MKEDALSLNFTYRQNGEKKTLKHYKHLTKLQSHKGETTDLQKHLTVFLTYFMWLEVNVTCKTDILLVPTDLGSGQTLPVMIRLFFVQPTPST